MNQEQTEAKAAVFRAREEAERRKRELEGMPLPWAPGVEEPFAKAHAEFEQAIKHALASGIHPRDLLLP
jgi:hypothetical protein